MQGQPVTAREPRPYSVAVIYKDDAVEVEVAAKGILEALDKARVIADSELPLGWVELVSLCDPEESKR
jgi:hypothetical protein